MPLNPVGNWYQQFMPNLNGRQIVDITFTDSLTGYAVSTRLTVADTSLILKTTNGGDSWFTIYSPTGYIFKRVQFVNQNTVYVGGTGILKTTNKGVNWFVVNSGVTLEDMYFINNDTAWYVYSEGLTGGVFRTTDSGASWQNQLNVGSLNPEKIYMFDKDLGFASQSTGQILRRTSDGGSNWTTLSTAGAFLDMYFADNLTGWKCGAPGGPGFRKTTDGGLNWIDHPLPGGGNIAYSQLEKLCALNKDTIYGVGPRINTVLGTRGMIVRTTNAGNNWTFQVPDSNINIFKYFHIRFVNPRNGWAYSPATGVHTTTGGDPVWLTPVTQISSEIPAEYKLFNNYPNPFNPSTNIGFRIGGFGLVTLKIFDITGRAITVLVNEEQNAGTYLIDWNGSAYSSGVYFYKLRVSEGKGVFEETKKMLMIK